MFQTVEGTTHTLAVAPVLPTAGPARDLGVAAGDWITTNLAPDGRSAVLVLPLSGDLKRLEVRGGDDVIAEFRNGEELELEGGSNDVGARLTISDVKLGKREIEWHRIRKIEFKDTPAKLANKLGESHGELIEIATYLTQDELAQMVKARRERVSTALNLLRQRGVIEYSPRGRLRVDMRALTE